MSPLSTRAARAQPTPFIKRLARLLAPVVIATTTVQPLAFAAPSPSLLEQRPRFVDVAVDSNVAFILDDSRSMEDIRLPVPAGLNPGEATGPVTVRGAATGYAAGAWVIGTIGPVDRRDEWIHRSPALNPLYYNPAVTYRPWNDNGRAGASGNFTDAPVGSTSAITDPANRFRFGITPHDPRYVGPNYVYDEDEVGTNFARRLPAGAGINAGANPPPVPDYLAPTRAPAGGFAGVTDGAATPRNQDLFTSPMVLADGGPPMCTVPTTPPTSTGLPTVDRRWESRQFTNRTTSTRPSTPVPTLARTTTDRSSQPRPVTNRDPQTRPLVTPLATAAATITARGQTPLSVTDRLTQTRPSSALPATTTRTTPTRPSTALPAPIDRTPTTRTTEYRYETGVCGSGSWSTWSTTDPGIQYCSNPTGEGVGVARVETRQSACPSGSSVDPANSSRCLSDCPTDTTATSTQCVYSCAGGTNLIGGRCYSACPDGFSIDGSAATQCISNCPSDTTATSTQCLGGTCPSGTHLIDGLCYGTCPDGYSINGSATSSKQCIQTSCPPGATTTATTCESCPTGFPTRSGSICYANCLSGTTLDPNNSAQCLSCPSGTLNAATAQCVSCPSGADLIGGQCYGACPTGYEIRGSPAASTQCIPTCPEGTGLASTATQCLGACPSGFPHLRTTTSTTCFAPCPTDTAEVGNSATNFAQCRTVCSPGFTETSTLCTGTCASGTTLISGQCYGTCPTDFSIVASTPTQCISDCLPGTTASGPWCIGACPASHPTSRDWASCYADCPATNPNVNPRNNDQCQAPCPSGTTASGTQCLSCPADNILLASGQCCPKDKLTPGNCPHPLPPGYTTCTAGQWVPDLGLPAPARYYVFAPVTSPSPADLPAALSNPANYLRVEINRDRPMAFPKAPSRTDCAGSECTWDEEAQNFANWFTYYRTRIFSAIAVTSESLSNLTRDRGLDGLRLAYGSINYFPDGFDPFNPPGRLPRRDLDGQPSHGALVRGVRPFTERTPPAPPELPDQRQEVFNWLFSLRTVGATPNREALDSVGRYFRRSDARGPWIQPDGADWSSSESPADHISCRRNYTIVITDGEWTNQPPTSPPQQPLVEHRTGTPPLNALSTPGPAYLRPGGTSHLSYDPKRDLQFSTNAGTAGGTLSDIALHYWRSDLRPDLVNRINPILPTPGSQGNPAFWQHMVPYLIGYGISASLDTAGTRAAIVASATTPVPVSWPSVEMGPLTVTDRDTAPIDCRYHPATNPAGCGRVDDTMRAALAARGNFLSAADVDRLAQGVAAAFTAIGEIEGTATALTGRSGTLRAGDRVFAASFRTNAWTGRLQSFDATAYFAGLGAGTSPPSQDSRFPAPASRNILTSTDRTAAVAFPTGAADFGNLSSAQQAALGSAALAQWLRGDQSREARSGGPFRNRPVGEIMGTIVNSQPFYSQAPDFGYNAVREPAAAGGGGAAYRTFVGLNRSHRPARVFVGSNSGMLHAFDASGTPATGTPEFNPNYMNEVFAYVPRAVYGSLRAFAAPGFAHRYLMDGPVVEGDVYTGGAWRTVVVGTTGAGPRGIFALDVTQRSGSAATDVGPGNVLWDIDVAADTAANIEHVGHILQPGVIGSGRDGEWYYFAGNGFESQNDKARLLAIRIRDGAITAIDTDGAGGPDPLAASPSGRPNGLGGVTPVYDAQRNIVAIYAGDRHGRLWKFDLGATSPSAWTSTLLFTATTPTGQMQSISAAPRVMRHPRGGHLIVFGTGKIFERDDLADRSIQTVYGVWERTPPATVARASLRPLTLVDQLEPVSGTRYRQLTGTDALDWATDLGWYFNLTSGAANGERVIASPTEHVGFASVTTFEPLSDGDPCKGGGRSFFYRLDVSGSFTRSPFAPVGPITALPDTVARNTVVGSELLGPAVSQLQTLRVPVTATVLTSRTLDAAGLDHLAGRDRRPRDPCEATRGGGPGLDGQSLGTPQFSCPGSPLRVWRELPRGPR